MDKGWTTDAEEDATGEIEVVSLVDSVEDSCGAHPPIALAHNPARDMMGNMRVED